MVPTGGDQERCIPYGFPCGEAIEVPIIPRQVANSVPVTQTLENKELARGHQDKTTLNRSTGLAEIRCLSSEN
jgi:hypothetical protein